MAKQNISQMLKAPLRFGPACSGAPGLKILFGLIIPLIVFCVLAIEVNHGKVYTLDQDLLLMLHAHATPVLDRWALGVSAIVSTSSILILIYMCYQRQWQTALFWLLATGGSAVLNFIIKHVIQRSRPSLWTLVFQQSTFSFPSGHMTEAMAIAVALFVLLGSHRHAGFIKLACAAFVVLVALCRMYLGLHYPSDIAGSCLLSMTWVLGLSMLFDSYSLASHGTPLRWQPSSK